MGSGGRCEGGEEVSPAGRGRRARPVADHIGRRSGRISGSGEIWVLRLPSDLKGSRSPPNTPPAFRALRQFRCSRRVASVLG